MQALMITSVTRHQQRFSMRNTKVNGRNNPTSMTQDIIGRRGAYLEETLKQGWRCTESWIVNVCFY
jgi:hypothetical protein